MGSADAADRYGFRRIYANPEQPPDGNFTAGTAHGLGFDDRKVIEVDELIRLAAGGKPPLTDPCDAAAIARHLDTALTTATGRHWVALERARRRRVRI